jgi:parallel beta-helix repeat protein
MLRREDKQEDRMRRLAFATLLGLAVATSARAVTVYVANNGVDGPSCGLKDSPCRSIGQAANFIAAPGDTVAVGPGKYGDLNGDQVLGNSPGEETGGFGCMIVLAQTVTVTSSDGAAATIVDGRRLGIGCNVGLLADGCHFGKAGKGFTVTDTGGSVNEVGIQLAGTNEIVSGNQVIGSSSGIGIETPNNSNTALITGNEVLGWRIGMFIQGSGAKTVSKNQVSQNGDFGINSTGSALISGNVVTDNGLSGIILQNAAGNVTGNAVHGNHVQGILVRAPFTGMIQKNDIFANGGNGSCGLQNGEGPQFAYPGVAGLVATNNYWGAATGPGSDPADLAGGACDQDGGSTTVTPFATKPINVKAPVKF